MTEPTIVTLADADACSEAAAERIVEILGVAIDARGEAQWATTGGSTPAGIYRHLLESSLRTEIDWRKVQLWWTDERLVPSDHPLSNAKIAYDVLFNAPARSGESGTGSEWEDLHGHAAGLPILTDRTHPIPVSGAIAEGHDQRWAAARYAEELKADGPETNDDGWPVFDLILLGIGPDGHIMSVFPGSEAFDESAWVVGVPAPTHVEPHVPRVTLHPTIAAAANDIVVVSHGASKAAILGDVLRGERDPRRLPAPLARRPGATWILARAAAANL
jgi:6-phosphogluconolactonase/glucosamine-6-phosphate isomerase/deaminase